MRTNNDKLRLATIVLTGPQWLMAEKITRAAFSRFMQVSKEAVNKAVAEGRIPFVQHKDGTILINPDEAKRVWLENPDARIPGKGRNSTFVVPDGADKTLTEYKRDKEKWASKKAEVEFREKAGELVEASRLKKVAFETAKLIRDNILGLPLRISHELAAENDAKKIERMLEKELTKCLEELSRGAKKLFKGEKKNEHVDTGE